MTSLGELTVGYLDRVVNRRDLTAVDELVTSDYRGSGPGWPTTLDALRRFYEAQMRDRPDWHIDVQEAVEVGDSVVLRAYASGKVIENGIEGRKAVEWLTHYRFRDGCISEINVLAVVDASR